MEDSILNFNKQFAFNPEIINSEYLKDFDHVILCGMGGSHLAADLIKTINPGIDIYVHKDYGLPPYENDFFKRGLLIASSYSGNTEETLSFFNSAYEKEYNISVISAGGKLLEEAKNNNVPYIEIPNTGIQPRQADGYFSIAILKFLGNDEQIAVFNLLEEKIDASSLEFEAENVAEQIGSKIPVIYSSNRNLHLAYNWKITLNETAKIPAFYNIFPELNHNEMQGFDLDSSRAEYFSVIFIEDSLDNLRIQDRMKITKEIYKEKNITVISINLDDELFGKSREEKVFNCITLADWTALKHAKLEGKEPEQVPLIEDFKNRLN